MAGDPTIKAKVITIPKTMPTKTKRLFMTKNYFTLVKNEMNYPIWKNPLIKKLQS